MTKLLPPDRETLLREYEGMSASALAKRYGVTRTTLLKWLDIFGIPARRKQSKGKRGESAERLVDTDGYVLVWRPDHPDARKGGYVLESRIVMAEVLGRPLLRTENVRYRDGDKQNNDPAIYTSSSAKQRRQPLTKNAQRSE